MPYLIEARKMQLDAGFAPATPGDLTYLFTKALLGDPREATLHEALQAAVDSYLETLSRQPRYADYAVILGCLDATSREYQRRLGHRAEPSLTWMLTGFRDEFYVTVVAPYEDTKIAENGDVYE